MDDCFVIRITGRDSVDLLHRITSNEVRGLATGSANGQCLLTAKGKIIVPFTLRREADHMEIEGPLELKQKALDTLDQYIFSEDVTLTPIADVIRASTASAAREADEDERIVSGRPRWGVDIDEDTIPWEAGMIGYVSTSKGCYTGQETIARIETYGKVARRLMRLTCASGIRPKCGEVMKGDKPAGKITSVTSKTCDDGYVALGMIRREVSTGETVTGADGVEWVAGVVI